MFFSVRQNKQHSLSNLLANTIQNDNKTHPTGFKCETPQEHSGVQCRNTANLTVPFSILAGLGLTEVKTVNNQTDNTGEKTNYKLYRF